MVPKAFPYALKDWLRVGEGGFDEKYLHCFVKDG